MNAFLHAPVTIMRKMKKTNNVTGRFVEKGPDRGDSSGCVMIWKDFSAKAFLFYIPMRIITTILKCPGLNFSVWDLMKHCMEVTWPQPISKHRPQIAGPEQPQGSRARFQHRFQFARVLLRIHVLGIETWREFKTTWDNIGITSPSSQWPDESAEESWSKTSIMAGLEPRKKERERN